MHIDGLFLLCLCKIFVIFWNGVNCGKTEEKERKLIGDESVDEIPFPKKKTVELVLCGFLNVGRKKR